MIVESNVSLIPTSRRSMRRTSTFGQSAKRERRALRQARYVGGHEPPAPASARDRAVSCSHLESGRSQVGNQKVGDTAQVRRRRVAGDVEATVRAARRWGPWLTSGARSPRHALIGCAQDRLLSSHTLRSRGEADGKSMGCRAKRPTAEYASRRCFGQSASRLSFRPSLD